MQVDNFSESKGIIESIFKQSLNVSSMGIDDNFFSAGANSLKLIKILIEISEATDIEIPMDILFEAPTLGGLYKYIADSESLAK